VTELSRGVDLPFDRLAEEHRIVIAELLLRAWADLSVTQGAILREGSEAEINALMEARLNTLVTEDEAWSQLVQCAARGKEWLNYDGAHLEKRPDLSLYLTWGHPSFPLTVECKLLDAETGKTVSLYCGNGLLRFVRGEYAWGHRDALMLGYVRDGVMTQADLRPLLEATLGPADPYATTALPTSMPSIPADAASSEHERDFEYVGGTAGDEPGPIAILHLWLTVPVDGAENVGA
jgi:hypothetical protein